MSKMSPEILAAQTCEAKSRSRIVVRFLKRTASTLFVVGSMLGCGGVPAPPSEDATLPPSPPAMTETVPKTELASLQEAPIVQLKRLLSDRRSKLAIGGGTALLLILLVGAGIMKILRGDAPPKPGSQV